MFAMTVSLASQNAHVRRSKPGSSGSMRVNNNGLPHLEHGGRSLSTNLYVGMSGTAPLSNWREHNTLSHR